MKSIYKTTANAIFTIAIVFGFSSVYSIQAADSPSVNLNEVAFEESISIENWMVDLDDWSIQKLEEESSFEEAVELENWMLSANESNWNSLIQVEKEQEIELEN